MSSSFEIRLDNAYGVQIDTLTRYHRCHYVRQLNDIGEMVLELPDIYPIENFKVDGRIYILKSINNGIAYPDMEACWLIQDVYRELRGRGEKIIRVECQDAIRILGTRIIAYNAGSSQADKEEVTTDNLIKAYARENLVSATVAARNLSSTLFTVQADFGAGPNISKNSSRRNLLATIQEICDASNTRGTYLSFDVVVSNIATGELQLRTYSGQRGIDHRYPSGLNPVVLDPDKGNLADVVRGFIRRNEITSAYAGGQGERSSRVMSPASNDDDRINESPFRLIEVFVNANQSANPDVVQNEADYAVYEGRPKKLFTARLVENSQTIRGIHWDYGDFVTANYEGESIDCHVTKVEVLLTPESGEHSNAILMADE